jgi:hypothetical protein
MMKMSMLAVFLSIRTTEMKEKMMLKKMKMTVFLMRVVGMKTMTMKLRRSPRTKRQYSCLMEKRVMLTQTTLMSSMLLTWFSSMKGLELFRQRKARRARNGLSSLMIKSILARRSSTTRERRPTSTLVPSREPRRTARSSRSPRNSRQRTSWMTDAESRLPQAPVPRKARKSHQSVKVKTTKMMPTTLLLVES